MSATSHPRAGIGLIAALSTILVICTASAMGKSMNLVANPSFETGAGAPEGWSLAPGTVWNMGSAHTGRRSVLGNAQTAAMAIDSDRSYRGSAWIRSASGTGHVQLTVLDAAGKVLKRVASPPASGVRGWRYTAVEVDLPTGSASIRLKLEGGRGATFDDIVLAPIGKNLVLNPTFETDAKGRVGMWSEEATAILSGNRRGSITGTKSAREGAGMVIEAPSGAWFGARVLPLPLLPGIQEYRASGWCRSESGKASVHVVWLDRADSVIRHDTITATGNAGGWTRYAGSVLAPAGAASVAMAAAVEHGKAVFDDFSLLPDQPVAKGKRAVRVFVNQVGYETRGAKSAVVASSFFPREASTARLEIVGPGGRVAASVPVYAARIHDGDAADWDEYYWRGDFTTLRKPGTYRAIGVVDGVRGRSFPFRIADHALLTGTGRLGVDFFFVQRCGFAVPGWHAACHLDDATLPNGKHIDATGGWHSAGDYNKIIYDNGDGGCAYSMLQVRDVLPAWFARFHRSGAAVTDVVDEVEWGARFMMKVRNPETGGLYSDVKQGPGRSWMKWSPPEVHTDNIIGTADDPVFQEGEGSSPFVPAVWLRLARDPETRSRDADLEPAARQYWGYLVAKDTSRSSATTMVAGLEMDRIAPDPEIREYVRQVATNLLKGQVTSGIFRGAWGTGGEINAGALASYALRYPTDPLVPQIKRACAKWRAFFATTCENPFGLTKQSIGEKDYFFEPTSTMGTNFVYMQRAWAAALIHRLNNDPEALRLATDQFDWILGKNPYDMCQFEGAGSRNLTRYHHRYDSIPGHERGAVPGAIPNGFVRDVTSEDRPGFDMSLPGPGKRHASYRCNEPWLVHNMWYFIALAALRGSPMTSASN